MGELWVVNRDRMCRCGNLKAKKALMCQECRIKHDKWVAEERARLERTCPVCGGLKKTKSAEMCRECRFDSIPTHPKHICPKCGGWKSKGGSQCRDCLNKERGWGDYSEKHLHRPEYREPTIHRGRADEAVHFSDERFGATTEAVACTVGS